MADWLLANFRENEKRGTGIRYVVSREERLLALGKIEREKKGERGELKGGGGKRREAIDVVKRNRTKKRSDD